MKVKVLKILRNYVIPLVIGVAIFAALMTIVYSESLEFWSRVSFTVATIAAIFAGVAALVARRSLQLTRETQRPFLNVSRCEPVWSHNNGHLTTVNYFVVAISNTGIFPADKLSILFNIRNANGNNQKHFLTPRNQFASICFPNDDISNLLFQEPDDANKLTFRKGGEIKVQIEISYKNKLTNRSHKTIRSYVAKDVSTEDRITPLPEEDYWD